MNDRTSTLLVTCALGAALLTGCAVSSPQIAYYSLYSPIQRPAAETAPATAALKLSIGPVIVPDILRQTQIATGGTDGRYRLSDYHRWSGEVDRDIARAVAEQLADSLGTELVAIYPWDRHFLPDYRVLIDVLSMAGEVGQEATLAVRWTLVDAQGKLPPLVRRSDLREVPTAAGHPAWVAAQQRNIGKLGREIVMAVQKLP